MNKGSKTPAWDNYSDLPSLDAYKNDYQDVLSTEDCVVDALEEYKKQTQCSVNSAGECLAYTEDVGSSNLSPSTNDSH